jgi:hypothetical protein
LKKLTKMCTYTTKIILVTQDANSKSSYQGHLGFGHQQYETSQPHPILASFRKVNVAIKTPNSRIVNIDGIVADSLWNNEHQIITLEISANQVSDLLVYFDFRCGPPKHPCLQS